MSGKMQSKKKGVKKRGCRGNTQATMGGGYRRDVAPKKIREANLNRVDKIPAYPKCVRVGIKSK